MSGLANSLIRRSLIEGVGVNDADYAISSCPREILRADGSVASRSHGTCQYYEKWRGIFVRCYSSRFLSTRPSYAGCTVHPVWHSFMAFRAWMDGQDWRGKEIDKDLLSPGNKVYGPDTCAFIDRAVNVFLTECKGGRSSGLIGAYKDRRTGRYRASCQSVETGKQEYLGHFDTAEEAHEAWRKFKLSQALILAARQSDPRVAGALIARYQAQETQEAA